jgi:acetolactate synthase-1/2/3 large subunit
LVRFVPTGLGTFSGADEGLCRLKGNNNDRQIGLHRRHQRRRFYAGQPRILRLQNRIDRGLLRIVGGFRAKLGKQDMALCNRQVLITNGQQTLGVALPWGIAASIVRPAEKILSISGDGGFLYSAMELETAVRLKANIVHMVWIDGTYDMVATQEKLKYGRTSGIDFGPIDYIKYAEAFGATGLMIDKADDIAPVMKKAFDTQGPVIVGVHVDYRDNHELFELLHEDSIQ